MDLQNIPYKYYQLVIKKAESSAQISSVQLVLTTYNALFGNVQYVIKSVFIIIGPTIALVRMIFRYINKFERSKIP